MEHILSIGFSSQDNEKLQMWLKSLDFQLQKITGNPLLELRKETIPHPVFIHIHSSTDIELLKKLITDFGIHTFTCGISLEKRKEIFLINQIKDLQLFFLPIKENEIKFLAAKLKQKSKDHDINIQLAKGLKKIIIHADWQTNSFHISHISRQITHILGQTGFWTNPSAKAHINLALEEALTNSIEHGNLELNSNLKPNSLFEVDQYEQLKQQRLQDETYCHRKIILYINIYAQQVEIRIVDQGPGFDASQLHVPLNNPDEKMKQIMDISGKGLLFIKKAFDIVEFKKHGREIILIKRKYA